MDDACRWCGLSLGTAPTTWEPGRAAICHACATRMRLEAAGRRRSLTRLVADARRLSAESWHEVRRAKAGVQQAAALRGARGSHRTAGAAPERPTEGSGPRVLVVDDDALIRDALRLLLEELGARVTVAAGGSEALRHLEARTFDLVLCDLRMPDVDGFEVIRRIRGNRRFEDLPVVAVSAVGPGTGPDRIREAGFDAHLRKPFDLKDLVKALDSAGRRAA